MTLEVPLFNSFKPGMEGRKATPRSPGELRGWGGYAGLMWKGFETYSQISFRCSWPASPVECLWMHATNFYPLHPVTA